MLVSSRPKSVAADLRLSSIGADVIVWRRGQTVLRRSCLRKQPKPWYIENLVKTLGEPAKRRKDRAAAARLAALRSRKLSPARRNQIARQAARARWARRKPEKLVSGGPPIWEIADELTRDVPPAAWNSLPRDLCEQLDHYIYGVPRL